MTHKKLQWTSMLGNFWGLILEVYLCSHKEHQSDLLLPSFWSFWTRSYQTAVSCTLIPPVSLSGTLILCHCCSWQDHAVRVTCVLIIMTHFKFPNQKWAVCIYVCWACATVHTCAIDRCVNLLSVEGVRRTCLSVCLSLSDLAMRNKHQTKSCWFGTKAQIVSLMLSMWMTKPQQCHLIISPWRTGNYLFSLLTWK